MTPRLISDLEGVIIYIKIKRMVWCIVCRYVVKGSVDVFADDCLI